MTIKLGSLPPSALSKRQRKVILDNHIRITQKTHTYLNSKRTNRTYECHKIYDGMVKGKIPFDPGHFQYLLDEVEKERVFRL